MAEADEVIRAAYAAFNARDVDAALALMTEDVSWPMASEGGRVVGRDEIRAYWLRQWAEFDPRVEPVEMLAAGESVDVTVHQVVRSREGEVLADGEVRHIFAMRDGLIARMDVQDGAVDGRVSAAFTRR